MSRLYSWRGGKPARFARTETLVPERPRRSPMAATVHSVNHNARMTASRRACASLLAAGPTRPVTDRPFLSRGEGQWPDTAAIPVFATVNSRADGCLLGQGPWTNPLVSRTFVQCEVPPDAATRRKAVTMAALLWRLCPPEDDPLRTRR
jgi:hypothetical protein